MENRVFVKADLDVTLRAQAKQPLGVFLSKNPKTDFRS